MEKLLVYTGPDSDSGSDSETRSTDRKDQSDLKSNFFGVDSHPPRSYASILNSENEKKSHSTSERDNSKDIPDGDFWKDFVPDTTSVESQHEWNNVPTKRTYQSAVGYIDNKRKCSHISEHSSYSNKKYASPSTLNITNSSSNIPPPCVKADMQQEKRKLFYVHSKITPYLTSSCSCKCSSKSNASWQSHDKAVNRLMWNRPNYSHLLLTAGMDSFIKVWNVWSSLDKCVSIINHHTKAVRNAIWGFQGRDIISCSYDKTAIVTDVETGTIKSRYTHPDFVSALTAHPFNPNCFVTGTQNLIQFWDQRTPLQPTKAWNYKDKMGQPQDLLFLQSGSELISCSDIVSRDSADRTIMAWDVQSGNVISNQIYQERYTCTRLKRNSSNSHFLAQTQGGYIALFSTHRPYKIDKNKRFEGHEMQGYNIGFDISHDGSLVYSGSAEGGVHCYDYRSGRLIKKCCTDNNSVITDVACHPVLPSLVASCSWGGNVTLWQ